MAENLRDILTRVDYNLNRLVTPQQPVKRLTPSEKIQEELQELFNFALQHSESLKLEVHSTGVNNFEGYEDLEYIWDMIHEFEGVEAIRVLPNYLVFITDLKKPVSINFEYYLPEPFEDLGEQYLVNAEKIENDFIKFLEIKEDLDNYTVRDEALVLPKETVKKEELEPWHRFQRVEVKYLYETPGLITKINFNLSLTIEELNFSINGTNLRIILKGDTFEDLDNLKYLKKYEVGQRIK